MEKNKYKKRILEMKNVKNIVQKYFMKRRPVKRTAFHRIGSRKQ